MCAGACGRKFRKLVGVVAQSTPLACPRCESTVLNRQISRFARVRSEDDTLNSLADEMETLGDSDDPKTMRRMMRDMTAAMGEDMDSATWSRCSKPAAPTPPTTVQTPKTGCLPSASLIDFEKIMECRLDLS